MKEVLGVVLLSALAMTAFGCGGTSNATSPDRNGGETAVTPGGTTSTGLTGPGTADEYGPDAQAKMDVAWQAFKDDSPHWPKLRQEWIHIGRRATSTLVENLYRAMILSGIGNYSVGYERSRGELILLGELAVPTLAGVLEKGTMYSPKDGRDLRMPTGMAIATVEIMALSGEFSVPYLAKLTRSDTPSILRTAAAGLGQTGARSAVDPLVRVLTGASDWKDRMVAARALGMLKFPDSEAALIRALEDSDDAVIEVSAGSLAQQRARGALPALDDRRQRAQDAGHHQISASCGAAARLIRSGR